MLSFWMMYPHSLNTILDGQIAPPLIQRGKKIVNANHVSIVMSTFRNEETYPSNPLESDNT
jgi:hypothetical protein